MVKILSNWERVTLGGLLHDIGKLFNRSDKYRGEGEAGEHPFLSSWFVDFLEKNGILQGDEILREIVQKHHESQHMPSEVNLSSIKDLSIKKLANIVAKADNYSSMEREGDTVRKYFKSVPLDSIFSRIDIGKGKTDPRRYYLREFGTEHLFSKDHSENTQGEIEKVIEKFLEEVKSIKTESFENLYLALLELIKKYTWALPSDTQKEICDLSLYDHLKTTSAIATASYNYHNEINISLEKTTLVSVNEGKTKEHFLLISGDISGIQSYIYSLVSSENIAKRLRARSFFIRSLTDIVSFKIVNELNLTNSNIIISNGGKFYILAQNTEETLQKIRDIKDEINGVLYNEYEGELFLNIQHLPVTGEDLGLKFSEKYDQLNDLLDRGKSQKFANEILNSPIIEKEEYLEDTAVNICPICGKYLKAKEEKSCRKCLLDEIWGSKLPKMKKLAFYKDKKESETGITLFGITMEIVTEKEKIKDKPFLVMDFTEEKEYQDLPRVTSFYGGYVPLRNSEIMTFEEIASESKSKNLGVLKGDIDDLGMIFSMGLKVDETDEEENRVVKDVTSISRVATLSRMIDSFFSYWLPKKLEEEQKTLGSHYVVYAGGDDFMIVGAWDNMITLSKMIRDEFEKFTGFNPNFTISMGLSITKDKDPIYLSSEWAGELESLVKNSGKNGLGVFDTYIPWSDYKEVFNYGEFLMELRDKYDISQSFLYRLLNYTEMSELHSETKNSAYLSYISKFEYDLARNIVPKISGKKEIIEKLTEYFGQEGFVNPRKKKFLHNYMRVAINYAVRKNREVKHV